MTPAPRAGLHTLGFFALIVVAVGAAGLLGVALWGPEKPIKNRTHLATDPPPPAELPVLASAEPVPPVAEPPAAPPPAEPVAAAPSPPAKKAKRGHVAAPKKKR